MLGAIEGGLKFVIDPNRALCGTVGPKGWENDKAKRRELYLLSGALPGMSHDLGHKSAKEHSAACHTVKRVRCGTTG